MFQTAADIANFVMAGNATVTVSSAKTGARYTFRIKAPKEESNLRFVSLLTGANNEVDYSYIGILSDVTRPTFRTTRKTRMGDDSAPVKAAKFLCERVLAHPEAPLPPGLEVRHEGRCGRCNHKLTVPESIDSGFGPECAGRVA